MNLKKFIWLLCLKFTHGNNLFLTEGVANTSISRATVQIVSDFYAKHSSTIVITIGAKFENRARQLDIVNEIIQGSNSEISVIIQNNIHVWSTYSQISNLIFVDDYESFSLIYTKMTEKADLTGFYTIVLTESHRDQYSIITKGILRKVLEDCWTIYITNVIVLATIEVKTRTAVYTYFPFTLHHCEVVVPVISNYFIHNSFLYKSRLFPPKLRNFYKCPLYVAVTEYIPYMILTRQKNGTVFATGIEGTILDQLSERLNFTPALIIANDEDIRSESPANRSTISIFMKLVHSGKANLTISSLAYTNERAQLLTASFPYLFTPLLFAVPIGRPYTPFEKLFLPFNYEVWCAVVLSFTVGCIVIFGMKYFSSQNKRLFLMGNNNLTPFLNMVNIFFGGSLKCSPTRNFARTMFCLWIVACYILRSAYQGSLFDFIQKSKSVAPIRTVSSLIQHDYIFYMSPIVKNIIKKPSRARIIIKTHNLTQEEMFSKLMDPYFRGTFLITQEDVAYHNMQHITNHRKLVQSTLDRVFLMVGFNGILHK